MRSDPVDDTRVQKDHDRGCGLVYRGSGVGCPRASWPVGRRDDPHELAASPELYRSLPKRAPADEDVSRPH